jgi:cytochrome P450
MRSVVADTELCGVEIPAGSSILVFFSAANRDSNEFDAPDELRLDRAEIKHHLAFGRGIHFCVGAPLARIEARVVLTRLLATTSTIALDPAAQPRHAYSLLTRRHATLPLTVGAATSGRHRSAVRR